MRDIYHEDLDSIGRTLAEMADLVACALDQATTHCSAPIYAPPKRSLPPTTRSTPHSAISTRGCST
jgi:hypothetical protein